MPVLILTKVVVAADFPRLQYVVMTQPWASAFVLIPRFLSLSRRSARAGSRWYPRMNAGQSMLRKEVHANEL